MTDFFSALSTPLHTKIAHLQDLMILRSTDSTSPEAQEELLRLHQEVTNLEAAMSRAREDLKQVQTALLQNINFVISITNFIGTL